MSVTSFTTRVLERFNERSGDDAFLVAVGIHTRRFHRVQRHGGRPGTAVCLVDYDLRRTQRAGHNLSNSLRVRAHSLHVRVDLMRGRLQQLVLLPGLTLRQGRSAQMISPFMDLAANACAAAGS